VAAGAVLCHPDFPVPLVSRVEARIVVLDVPTPVLAGQQVPPPPFPETKSHTHYHRTLLWQAYLLNQRHFAWGTPRVVLCISTLTA